MLILSNDFRFTCERIRDKSKWQINVKKAKLYSNEGKRGSIQCRHLDPQSIPGGKGVCRVGELSHADLDDIFGNPYDLTGKLKQDAFLLKFLSTSQPKRQRQRKAGSSRRCSIVVTYKVRWLITLWLSFLICPRAMEITGNLVQIPVYGHCGSPMTSSDAETDIKPIIIIFF